MTNCVTHHFLVAAWRPVLCDSDWERSGTALGSFAASDTGETIPASLPPSLSLPALLAFPHLLTLSPFPSSSPLHSLTPSLSHSHSHSHSHTHLGICWGHYQLPSSKFDLWPLEVGQATTNPWHVYYFSCKQTHTSKHILYNVYTQYNYVHVYICMYCECTQNWVWWQKNTDNARGVLLCFPTISRHSFMNIITDTTFIVPVFVYAIVLLVLFKSHSWDAVISVNYPSNTIICSRQWRLDCRSYNTGLHASTSTTLSYTIIQCVHTCTCTCIIMHIITCTCTYIHVCSVSLNLKVIETREEHYWNGSYNWSTGQRG